MRQESSIFQKFAETGKHGLIFGLGTALQTGIGLFMLPIYTNRFSPEEYGVLGIITVTGSVMVTLFSMGMHRGRFRSYYDYTDENIRKKLISTALLILLISSMTLIPIGLLLSPTLSNFFFQSAEFSKHFLYMFIISSFGILNTIPFIIFRAKKKSTKYITYQLSQLVFTILIIIYLVVVLEIGILGVLIGTAIATGIFTLLLYHAIRKDISFGFLPDEFKKMLKFGLPLVPANLSVFVFASTDRYFLNFLSTGDELGLYVLGYNFGLVITILLAAPLTLVWSPMYLSMKDDSNINEFQKKGLTYVVMVAFFLFIALSLLSKEILIIFTGEKFWGAYAVIPIIILTYSLWSVTKVINIAIIVKRKTGASVIIFFIGALINIGLNFLLIPKFGMMGAAYATLITYCIMLVALFLYNHKLMPVAYEWSRMLKIVVISALLFTIGFFTNIESLSLSIITKILLILLYPVILYFSNFFPDDELIRIKQVLRFILRKIGIKKAQSE